MTYVIGFRAANCCYLVADSAVTSTKPRTDADRSSFDERYVVELNRAVGEGALKIFNLGRAAISGAGDVDLILAVARNAERWLAMGIAPDEAFQRAIDSVTPLSKPTALQAALIWRDDSGSARLRSFNASLDAIIRDHDDDVVQLGSIDENHKNLTQNSVAMLRSVPRMNGQQICASAVGLCQSYGAHAPLMEKGIGGAFYGAYTADDSTIKWNADISYLIYDGSVVNSFGIATYVCFRDNVCVCVSTIPPNQEAAGKFRFRVTINANDDTSEQEARARAEEVLQTITDGIPDYFIFLDKSMPRTMVAELLGHSEHRGIVVGKLDVKSGVRPVKYRKELEDMLYRTTMDRCRPFCFVAADPAGPEKTD